MGRPFLAQHSLLTLVWLGGQDDNCDLSTACLGRSVGIFFSAFWRIFVDFRYVNGRQIQTRGDKWVSWYQYRIRDAPDFWPAGLSENRLPNIRLAVYSLLISGSEPTSCSSCKMLIPIQEVKTPRDDWNGRTKLSFNFILKHRIAIFCHSSSHIIFF